MPLAGPTHCCEEENIAIAIDGLCNMFRQWVALGCEREKQFELIGVAKVRRIDMRAALASNRSPLRRVRYPREYEKQRSAVALLRTPSQPPCLPRCRPQSRQPHCAPRSDLKQSRGPKPIKSGFLATKHLLSSDSHSSFYLVYNFSLARP